MRQVGIVLGAPAATVSQVERAERAVKPDKLSLWAKALGVNENTLRTKYKSLEHKYPSVPNMPRRSASIKVKTLEFLIRELRAPERERVMGYVEAIIENREN